MINDTVKILKEYGFSSCFIQDLYKRIPSIFELTDTTISNYLDIVKQTMKNHPMDVQAIENAFYEEDNNHVIIAFEHLKNRMVLDGGTLTRFLRDYISLQINYIFAYNYTNI